MSFDKFLLAVESLDLSQADKRIVSVSSFQKLVQNVKIYSYTKKTIWHLTIWQKSERIEGIHFAERSGLSC